MASSREVEKCKFNPLQKEEQNKKTKFVRLDLSHIKRLKILAVNAPRGSFGFRESSIASSQLIK